MNPVLAIIAGALFALLIVVLYLYKKIESRVVQKDLEIAAVKQEAEAERKLIEEKAARIQAESEAACNQKIVNIGNEAQSAIAEAKKLVDRQLEEMGQDSERVRQHYAAEARRMQEKSNLELSKALTELEQLRKFEKARDAEVEAHRLLSEAIAEATGLKQEAHLLLEQAKGFAAGERSEAVKKATETRDQADALLRRATREAGRIFEEASKRAAEIAGDAYTALRDKVQLEEAAKAIRNVVDGYGDRYIVPTRSLLDDLASDFGHTEAGQSLAEARSQTRRIVEEGQAATSGYTEDDRRKTAMRFVIDAFNGRVDAILSRVKHDNYGTLKQEINDAFNLVNQNGVAFRNTCILPVYCDARLAELKWAVVVQELRLKEREEQRRISEQMREEEKARREYERAIKESADEEAAIKNAMELAQLKVQQATTEQRAKYEEQLAALNQRLLEAEAKNQRAVSMAQQTRSGYVYIISNIGSFGQDVFKVGMTRRLEPMDRVRELGDASVPFTFDVHAMIYSEDAPTLENLLHNEFDDLRLNKVNYRKEFFRLPLERIRTFVTAKKADATFTMLAEAREYHETQALERMTPEEREKYHLRRQNGDDGFDD